MDQNDVIKNEFEKWVRGKGLSVAPNPYGMGTYDDADVELLWECWKTAWDKAFEVL